jgi:hypothetical protein
MFTLSTPTPLATAGEEEIGLVRHHLPLLLTAALIYRVQGSVRTANENDAVDDGW